MSKSHRSGRRYRRRDKDKYGIFSAMKARDLPALMAILEKISVPQLMQEQSASNRTPLHYAIILGDLEIFSVLVKEGFALT